MGAGHVRSDLAEREAAHTIPVAQAQPPVGGRCPSLCTKCSRPVARGDGDRYQLVIRQGVVQGGVIKVRQNSAPPF